MGSSRLPGKTLAPIMGRPMLELLIERLRRSRLLDQVVIATTVDPADDAIEELAGRLRVGCFRGSVDNVLERVLHAARAYDADLIVETTGDNPLIDLEIVDQLIAMFSSGSYDYLSNDLEETFPDGLNTKLFLTGTLTEVNDLTQDPRHREHVSLYIYEHPERYRLGNLAAPPELHRPEIRLTVDRAEDLALVTRVFENLYPQNAAFSARDIIRFLDEHPRSLEINGHLRRQTVRRGAERTYRAAIVGCGRIGCGFDDDPRRKHVSTHAGAYVRSPAVELVALADLDPAKLERYGNKFQVQGRYLDYREMLRREAVDILSICTGSASHRQITENAVAAGVKAVFCEKPVADSLKAADAMIRGCAQAGVLLMVDCQRRFDGMHRQLAQLLREERLGRVQQVTCYYSGGVANNGGHLFDLLRFLFGEAAWVQGIVSGNPSPDPDDPNVDGCVKFNNGLLAMLQSCDSSLFSVFELNILAARGRLAVRRFGIEVQFEEVRQSEEFSEDRDFYPATPPVKAGSGEFMLQGVAHLIECLRQGRQPVCSGEDGRRALELVTAILQSARNGGGRVAIPLASSSMVIHSR